MTDQRDILVLFDVDGTLTPSRLVIKPDMKEFILELKKKVVIGKSGGLRKEKQEGMSPVQASMNNTVEFQSAADADACM